MPLDTPIAWLRAAEGREVAFELADLGAVDELAVVRTRVDGVVDARAEAAALRRDIDERERSFDAGVLVHHVSGQELFMRKPLTLLSGSL